MIARLKRKHHQDADDRGNRVYWRREKALDEALKNTFPASDPVSVEQRDCLAMLKVTARPLQSRHCGSTSVGKLFMPLGTAMPMPLAGAA